MSGHCLCLTLLRASYKIARKSQNLWRQERGAGSVCVCREREMAAVCVLMFALMMGLLICGSSSESVTTVTTATVTIATVAGPQGTATATTKVLPMSTTGLSSTTIVPTATPMLPKAKVYFSFDLLVSYSRIRFLPPQETICDSCMIDALFQKKWILEHPIKIGLSVAVIILSK